MPRIPEFHATLAKIATLHEAKNQDYATNKDPFSNFVFTETALELFRSNADKTFVWPIATKLARLSVLLSKTGLPNFESIEDSFDDIAAYVILWKCAYMRAHNPQAQTNVPEESELEATRRALSEFVITLSEKQAKRLYALATNLLHHEPIDSPNAPSVGRLNYARPDDERKPSGLSDLSPAQRRTAEADQLYRGGLNPPRK